MEQENRTGTDRPANGGLPSDGEPSPPESAGSAQDENHSGAEVSYSQVTDAQAVEDPYAYPETAAPPPPAVPEPAAKPAGQAPPPAPPKDDGKEDGDQEEDGMLRMSFLEHLEELRRRIIGSLMGVGIAFAFSLFFAERLWLLVSDPAVVALKELGADPNLAQLTPMDAFSTIWIKLPMLSAIFIASPWILYQVWAFVAPGLYKRERRWAGPFVVSTAGLFIAGGLFAYFVLFRLALKFLLGIGKDINVKTVISLTEYFDTFVNVTLGAGLIFETPILIFFLILIRIVTPAFLMRNSRYAILIIVIAAAIITPTPDIYSLMLLSVPMIVLFFGGVYAGYLVVLKREGKPLTKPLLITVALMILLLAGVVYLTMTRYGYHLVPFWPFFSR